MGRPMAFYRIERIAMLYCCLCIIKRLCSALEGSLGNVRMARPASYCVTYRPTKPEQWRLQQIVSRWWPMGGQNQVRGPSKLPLHTPPTSLQSKVGGAQRGTQSEK